MYLFIFFGQNNIIFHILYETHILKSFWEINPGIGAAAIFETPAPI